MHPPPVLLPGKSYGRRNLVGCSPWGRKESDTTERLHFHFSLSCIGEGNGNSLQCSCLENPRDGGAWWAAVYGVAQRRTRLTRLSRSRSTGEKEIKTKNRLWKLSLCSSYFFFFFFSILMFFWCGPFCKVPTGFLTTLLSFYVLLCFGHKVCGVLGSWPGTVPALVDKVFHWTARKAPLLFHFEIYSKIPFLLFSFGF